MWMHQSKFFLTQEILGVNDKNYRGGNIDEFSEASKVSLEQKFTNHDNFSAEWCFKTRESEEENTYNDVDYELRCKQNDNQMYNFL